MMKSFSLLFSIKPNFYYKNKSFQFLHFTLEEKPIRWMGPDRYRDAVSNHVCFSLTPSMGKCNFNQQKTNTRLRISFISYWDGENDLYRKRKECDLLTLDIDEETRYVRTSFAIDEIRCSVKLIFRVLFKCFPSFEYWGKSFGYFLKSGFFRLLVTKGTWSWKEWRRRRKSLLSPLESFMRKESSLLILRISF